MKNRFHMTNPNSEALELKQLIRTDWAKAKKLMNKGESLEAAPYLENVAMILRKYHDAGDAAMESLGQGLFSTAYEEIEEGLGDYGLRNPSIKRYRTSYRRRLSNPTKKTSLLLPVIVFGGLALLWWKNKSS